MTQAFPSEHNGHTYGVEEVGKRGAVTNLTLKGQYEEALRLVSEGKPREAIAICRRILQAFPKHIGSYAVLGQATMALGNDHQAADLFRRVLSADPENVSAYAGLATLYGRQERYDEAQQALERAFELAPGDRAIRQELCRLYTRRGLSAGRLKMTRAALARTYLRGHLYAKAIQELRELVAHDPQRFDLRVALAEALWHDSRYEDAAVVCQGILTELPDCLKANLILGQVWLNTERDEQARACLQKAQTLDPDNAVAQSTFGSRSALPPRVARLPLRSEDLPDVALPYLVDDEEIVAESVVIEGQLGLQMTEKAEEELQTFALPPLLAEEHPTVVTEPSVGERQGMGQPSGNQELDREQRLADETNAPKLSLTDVQRHYVREHPDDFLARLDLARLLCGDGALDQALKEYRYLIQEDYTTLSEVIRDLDLLCRRHPDVPSLGELLRLARQKASLGRAP